MNDYATSSWFAHDGAGPTDSSAARGDATAAPRRGLRPGALRRVLEHVESGFAGRVDLNALAAIAGLSACHFARAFKRSMGVPPHRFLLERRVAAAAQLIKDTDLPLAQISLQVGFCDQSHFSRTFAHVAGETPREFRWRYR